MPPQDESITAATSLVVDKNDEQQALINSLSFSSSEGCNDRAVDTKVLLSKLQEEVTATRMTNSSHIPMHELLKGAAYLSASETTAVASNVRNPSLREKVSEDSPPHLIGGIGSDEQHERQNYNRSIFGQKERKKYNVRQHEARNASNITQQIVSPLSTLQMEANIPTPSTWVVENNKAASPSPSVTWVGKNGCNALPVSNPPRDGIATPPRVSTPPIGAVGYQKQLSLVAISPITPARVQDQTHELSPTESYKSTAGNREHYSVHPDQSYSKDIEEAKSPLSLSSSRDVHHLHACLLSVAFFFIWTPQNILAPNLTQAAADFGYENGNDRDLYLGSYLALVSSVLSLPVSAGIGFASDVVPCRRSLISATILVGGIAAIWTSMAQTYPQLLLSRFIGGSAMSGSVPVVFSLLSDWFHEADRNAASSGFTAMMGAGIVIGQVFAGWTGPSVGWRYSYMVSGTITILLAAVTMLFVNEPIRGGKEKVLQRMIASGTRYDKKLTWSQFVASMTRNSSNFLLISQGFFCNIPWGMMFVFLNDFLSQEKGLTVADATFIVAVFGFGCAVGGIIGGIIGGMANQANRSYLPLFMALTTYIGILPFLAMVNGSKYTQAIWKPCVYLFFGGSLASMPGVNGRPCMINCNPPEIRGAVLTAANLVINAARGTGVSTSSSRSIWLMTQFIFFC